MRTRRDPEYAQLDFIDGLHHKRWKPLDPGTVVLTSGQASEVWRALMDRCGTDALSDDVVAALCLGFMAEHAVSPPTPPSPGVPS